YRLAATTITAAANITRAPLTITADNQSVVEGNPLPPLTVHYTGFVHGETTASLTAPPTVTTTATPASAPGTYALTPAGAVDVNYAISYVAGTLTVTAAPLRLTAPVALKVKGGVVSFKGHPVKLNDPALQAQVQVKLTTSAGTFQAHAAGVKIR